MVDKKVLRKVYLEKRLALSEKELKTRNDLLLKQFLNNIDFTNFNCLHTFLSIADKKEVNTHQIIEKALEANPKISIVTSKTLPKGQLEHYVLDDETIIENNSWGIPQPVKGKIADIEKIDLVIVPLITFDTVGHRVGYGKGYYDRFLKKIPKAKKVGVSLAPPLDEILYSNEMDVKMDCCVTPFRFYSF